MVQEPLRRYCTWGEGVEKYFCGEYSTSTGSAAIKHPSENNGGFTWVTCRLTIREDVMAGADGLSIPSDPHERSLYNLPQRYRLETVSQVADPWPE